MKTYEYNGITCETPKKLKFQVFLCINIVILTQDQIVTRNN